MVISSLHDPHVLVCMPDNVGAYEITHGVLRYLFLDPDQDSTELLDSLRCYPAASDGLKHDVP